MTASNPIPVKRKDLEIALRYLDGKMTRAEVNRAYKLGPGSPSGLHRVARASKQLVKTHPELEQVIHKLHLALYPF